jgi:hypothetical protein
MLPQKWPQWTIIPIGFLLTVAIIGAGLGMVAAVQAAVPGAEASPNPASSYEASLTNPDLLGYIHAQEGLGCLDCHAWQSEQVDAEALAEGSAKSMAQMDTCFNCHVDNEHSSYEQVIERTADYVMTTAYLSSKDVSYATYIEGSIPFIIEDQNLNPHDPHATTESEQRPIECSYCHQMHKESPLADYCYGCHHKTVLDACKTCHG